jgi:alpha-tubulin suppressor-like RCC1 family protein
VRIFRPGVHLFVTLVVILLSASLLPEGFQKEGARANQSIVGSVVKTDSGQPVNQQNSASGQVWAWGANQDGQLGNGVYQECDVPIPVSGLDNVTAVAGGDSFSLALQTDGSVWAWGDNNFGQLGNGTFVDNNTPLEVSGISSVTAIDCGGFHSLALKNDGTVWSWGYNGSDLGDPDNYPLQVNELSAVTAVSGGFYHSLALKNDGTVWAWGINDDGQLGNGSFRTSVNPIQVSGLTGITAVSCGEWHSLALKSDGTVWAWGYNREGQVSNSIDAACNIPQQVNGLSDIKSIAGGGYHNLALKSDGSVWAWGCNWHGQLGKDANSHPNTPAQVDGLGDVTAIAGGQFHSLALKSDGSVWAWGINWSGQAGNRNSNEYIHPWPVTRLEQVKNIAGGGNHSLLLGSMVTHATTTTVVSSLNPFQYGQDARFTATVSVADADNCTPKGKVIFMDGKDRLESQDLNAACQATTYYNKLGWGRHVITALYQGYVDYLPSSQTLTQIVIPPPLGDGSVWAWGSNDIGQLGNGTDAGTSRAATVKGLNEAIALAGGENHSLALKSDGTVWAWGYNREGQLGIGSNKFQETVVQISDLVDITAIAAGGNHSLALKSDGSVWAWGVNTSGQLANGTNHNSPTPALVKGLNEVMAIAGGGYHSLALKSDGTVWAWGDNTRGQLGNGSNANSTSPAPVQGLNDVTAIACGESHSLALKSDGTVWTWGYNNDEQLGDGTDASSQTPVLVKGLSNVKAIAGGGFHCLALKFDGTVWAWGDNEFGQSGKGEHDDYAIPTPINGLNHVTAIAGGLRHSLALKNDGTVWAWGVNWFGQLGDGTNTESITPVPVYGLVDVTAIASGWYHSLALGSLEIPTTSTLSSSINPSEYGQAVIFTTTVNSEEFDYERPTGTVTLREGEVILGSAILEESGQSEINIDSLSGGTHCVTAAYSGDDQFAPCLTNNIEQIVDQSVTNISLISSANHSTSGQKVTFTAKVNPAPDNGTVQFQDNGANLGKPLAVKSTGQIACSTSALAIGNHSITATFSGCDNYTSSNSPILSLTVKKSSSGGGAGGGGSPTPRVYLNGFMNNTPLNVNSGGVLENAAVLQTSDGKVTLNLDRGTRLATPSNTIPASLKAVSTAPSSQSSGETVIVLSYTFSPEDTRFDPAITLTFACDPAQLPAGLAASDLYIACWDGAQWQKLDSQSGTGAPTLSTLITHFSSYALMGKINPPVSLPPVPASTRVPSSLTIPIPPKTNTTPTQSTFGPASTPVLIATPAPSSGLPFLADGPEVFHSGSPTPSAGIPTWSIALIVAGCLIIVSSVTIIVLRKKRSRV